MFKLIVNLPREVAARVLGSFVDIGSVGRLDSAVCSHVDRRNLLALLTCNEVSFPFNCDLIEVGKYNKCIQWFILRELKGSSFNYNQHRVGQNEDLLVQLFQRSAKTLQEVNGGDILVIRALSSIVGEYTNLRSADIRSEVSSELFTALLTKMWGCVREFRFYCSVELKAGQSFFQVVCPKVTKVTLHSRLPQDNLVGFGDCFPNLEDLKLITVSVSSLLTQLQRLARLKNICLMHINDMTDSMITALPTLCPRLTGFQVWGSPNVSYAAVMTLCEQCPLRTLALGLHAADLTVAEATHISECLKHSLTNLAVCQDRAISGDALRAFKKCTLLETLDISGLEGTVAADLCDMFSTCAALRDVNIGTTDGVDDNVLKCVALSCPQLITLTIGACTGSEVSPAGILSLAEHATNLTSLTVIDNYQTTMISSLAIAAMKKLYPKLSISREEV